MPKLTLRPKVHLMSNRDVSSVPGVSIGQAAALYQVAPSTLRWWEKCGLLPEPPRVNGRRVYDEVALRRIGLAYLCCVTGAMPLLEAARVTSGEYGGSWRADVSRHAARLEAELHKLQEARRYLLHLLQCPDEDIAAECSHLEGELVAHTLAGGLAGSSLIEAATAARTRSRSAVGDVTDEARDEIGDASQSCNVCGSSMVSSNRGRRRKYCSAACRQRHYRRQRTATQHGSG